MENKPEVLISNIIASLDADLFLYSAEINNINADSLIREIRQTKNKKDTIALVLSTMGGDPNAAYRITRFIKSQYKKFILFIFGYCKSAGTLIAIGADEIVMSCFAELGPLDIQIYKEDSFTASSGLDIQQALDELEIRILDVFQKCFVQMIRTGGGIISTKTATDIASSIAVGLLSPITAQIDPLRLGENSRAIKIVHQYGIRLNGDKEDMVRKLVSFYPSHDFVIDYAEAKDLFGKNNNNEDIVRQPNSEEEKLEKILFPYIRWQNPKAIIVNLSGSIEDNDEIEEDNDEIEEDNDDGDETNEDRENGTLASESIYIHTDTGKENSATED